MKHIKSFSSILWIVAVVIIIIISLSPKFAPSDKYNVDKFLHFGTYFSLGAFAATFFHRRRSTFLSIGILIITAIGTEIGQLYVPNRSASIGDVAANISGIVVSFLIVSFLIRLRK